MSWTPLNHRIHHLPLILAGPILRRTQSGAVTVWLALKAPRQVELKVFSTQGGTGEIVGMPLLEGANFTVQLGKYLHVVAVTAKPIDSNLLTSGQIYAYDIEFAGGGESPSVGVPENEKENLLSCLWPTAADLSVLGPQTIGYFAHGLPTFALPPQDLNYLRIAHGSCRKPHGDGRDALPILDNSIEQFAGMANFRPHQLFLTGDQIYGDDVADAMLWALTDAGDTLLGWEENLPLMDDAQIKKNLCTSIPKKSPNKNVIRAEREIFRETPIQKASDAESEYKKPIELQPGTRSDIARDFGGFTAMLVNKPDKAKSHLFGLGEYCAMYLLVWSPVLWCDSFPKGKDICPDSKEAKVWDREVVELDGFCRNLWRVRRALANIPTYMICDDHDVSDDCFLNREWCYRVLGKPLGRRVVQNALLAYAVFQAWGNTPAQFEDGRVGDKLLRATEKWSNSAGTDVAVWEEAASYLGIPAVDIDTGLPKFKLDDDVLILDRDGGGVSEVLSWHFTVRSFKHEVIVLDTRTWRGYPTESAIDPPMLLTHKGFEEQIQQPLRETELLNKSGEFAIEATLVVVPTNLVGLWIIDAVQRRDVEQGKVFNTDAGDAWNFHELAFVKLLSEFFKQRDRVIVLTGDIHYAAAVRLSYWSDCHFGDSRPEIEHLSSVSQVNGELKIASQRLSVLAQLTASAFINEEWTTHVIHTKIKSLFPERSHECLGWNEPRSLVKIPRRGRKKAVAAVVRDRQSLPDWGYRVDWMKRQKSRVFLQHESGESSSILPKNKLLLLLRRLWNLIALLWRNRWLQEGDEIVGYGNMAIVSFQWPADGDGEKAVIQNVYWRPLWAPDSVVYSQYFVPLGLDESRVD
ncbi:MAG: PhoD-like phosphatase [Microcoleus sp. PH2017_10_PVI_O_A]|uniref:PhoD-like phosphatase n=1 Tax=unclassified Microcoleus TaxID=2642155 RepID=UPI001E0DB174|nr:MULTISPECIES: PhoD-like phosphatase [unclassified Microcoleus]TAE82105.1 MAG: PhoD-like phosphatase [Oscillatoriales cyanobacterium]MCC3404877.1 PhoD-like phosphatase [Microcoleus sp. PH2017_10_PVI_O_A]MCC3460063.1 PhoD-like phosphatase [Microcoleus sp. PH2017_11_PCY_U_A]MCC3478583.1 PhoD-like phosphatase [Microcoleus sp. PH2017_12_PCY_D_A]MCC3527820.1 PhoD-like phosphatase [Microcoleus sp. PH2017_21_RUC_O_A]